MGLLDQVVATGSRDDLNVLHAVEHGEFPQGCPIAPELVGVNDLRYVIFLQQSAEKRSGGLSIPVLL
jgi:hypothetical protein